MPTQTDSLTIPSSLVVASGKGGVGKTAVASTVAGLWASEGMRVLLVDTDTQASATLTMGINPAESGNGRGLLDSVMHGDPLTVVSAPGRANLDVVPAGRSTATLAKHLVMEPDSVRRFAEPFLRAANRWDRIIIDVPPAGGSAHIPTVALTVGRYLVSPTSDHPHDLEGLRVLGDDLEETGSEIILLGVILYKVGASSTAGRRKALAEIEEMLQSAGSFAKPFKTIVRHAPKAYGSALEQGLLVPELSVWASKMRAEVPVAQRIEMAKNGELPAIASNLPEVASEFRALANEINERIRQVENITH